MNSLGLRLKGINDILAFFPKIYTGSFKHKFTTYETWIHYFIILNLPLFKKRMNKNGTLFYLLSRLAFYRKKLTWTPYSPEIPFSPSLFSSFRRWQGEDIPKESLTWIFNKTVGILNLWNQWKGEILSISHSYPQSSEGLFAKIRDLIF